MKRNIILASLMIILFHGIGFAAGGVDGVLKNLSVQAQTDLKSFSLNVSTQFGVPLTKVQAVIKTVESPADAFMCFQLGQMTQKPSDDVVAEYQKGKGWGVIAQRMGIKPGSAEFHALKEGDFVLDGKPGGGSKAGKG